MALSRRDFLAASAVIPAALPLISGARADAATEAALPLLARSRERILLERLTYGARPGDEEALRAEGLAAWLDRQLAAEVPDSEELRARLATAKLKIAYDEVSEDRPLASLDISLAELYAPLLAENDLAWEEKVRPAKETQAATVLRAVYSPAQLRERMVGFWHDHFSVSAFSDEGIARGLPHWDAMIRRGALGNFRTLLEEVARHPVMLLWLDNATSKASPANENFARELFELYTLGAMNYHNALYNRWRAVPGADKGAPIGYIDEDVYEAARAFTGWTFGNGSWCGPNDEHFPKTGEFLYHDAWHDPYQKRVLATEFDPNSPPMADGKRVLDLLAAHPGTARHLATKLCRRFIADDPPAELVDRVAAEWLAKRESPTQIADVMRLIATSEEITQPEFLKVKRPLEMAVGFFRAMKADVQPHGDFFWGLEVMNHHLFGWPSPAGHPDTAEPWLSSGAMVMRWNSLLSLVSEESKIVRLRDEDLLPGGDQSSRQVVSDWCARLLGGPLAKEQMERLEDALAMGRDPKLPPPREDLAGRVRQLIAMVAMTPEFQTR